MATLLHTCADPTEAQELFEPQGLYLKPIAKLSISVQLPQLKTPGKSISSWEVMEKIKNCIKPDQFTALKVSKSTLEFIRFEAEMESKNLMKAIASRLDNKTIKLAGFPDCLKVRAAEAKINFPTRHDWDSYFRDAKNMNEMKPGERPDTIHLQMLPCKWFANRKDSTSDKPSEYILKKVFESFGNVRSVDIPMLDPYRREMTRNSGTIQTFSFGQDLTFETFVQFQEYIGFVKAMTALRGMKLVHKSEDGSCFATCIKVDFDRSKHLSDKNIRKRRQEREKLIQLEKEKEDRVWKERRDEEKRKDEEKIRLEEEEKNREHKREEKLRKREERKKQKEEEKEREIEKKRVEKQQRLEEAARAVQSRKEEATRLLASLVNNVKIVKQKEELRKRMAAIEQERLLKIEQMKKDEERSLANAAAEASDATKQAAAVVVVKEQELCCPELVKREQMLRERLIQNLKFKKEQSREALRRLSGRTKLRSVLISKTEPRMLTKQPTLPKMKSVLVVNQ